MHDKLSVLASLKVIRDVLDDKGLDKSYDDFYKLEKAVMESYTKDVKQTKISNFLKINSVNWLHW